MMKPIQTLESVTSDSSLKNPIPKDTDLFSFTNSRIEFCADSSTTNLTSNSTNSTTEPTTYTKPTDVSKFKPTNPIQSSISKSEWSSESLSKESLPRNHENIKRSFPSTDSVTSSTQTDILPTLKLPTTKDLAPDLDNVITKKDMPVNVIDSLNGPYPVTPSVSCFTKPDDPFYQETIIRNPIEDHVANKYTSLQNSSLKTLFSSSSSFLSPSTHFNSRNSVVKPLPLVLSMSSNIWSPIKSPPASSAIPVPVASKSRKSTFSSNNNLYDSPFDAPLLQFKTNNGGINPLGSAGPLSSISNIVNSQPSNSDSGWSSSSVSTVGSEGSTLPFPLSLSFGKDTKSKLSENKDKFSCFKEPKAFNSLAQNNNNLYSKKLNTQLDFKRSLTSSPIDFFSLKGKFGKPSDLCEAKANDSKLDLSNLIKKNDEESQITDQVQPKQSDDVKTAFPSQPVSKIFDQDLQLTSLTAEQMRRAFSPDNSLYKIGNNRQPKSNFDTFQGSSKVSSFDFSSLSPGQNGTVPVPTTKFAEMFMRQPGPAQVPSFDAGQQRLASPDYMDVQNAQPSVLSPPQQQNQHSYPGVSPSPSIFGLNAFPNPILPAQPTTSTTRATATGNVWPFLGPSNINNYSGTNYNGQNSNSYDPFMISSQQNVMRAPINIPGAPYHSQLHDGFSHNRWSGNANVDWNIPGYGSSISPSAISSSSPSPPFNTFGEMSHGSGVAGIWGFPHGHDVDRPQGFNPTEMNGMGQHLPLTEGFRAHNNAHLNGFTGANIVNINEVQLPRRYMYTGLPGIDRYLNNGANMPTGREENLINGMNPGIDHWRPTEGADQLIRPFQNLGLGTMSFMNRNQSSVGMGPNYGFGANYSSDNVLLQKHIFLFDFFSFYVTNIVLLFFRYFTKLPSMSLLIIAGFWKKQLFAIGKSSLIVL